MPHRRRTLFLRGLMLSLWMGMIFYFSHQLGKVLPGPPPLGYVLERKSAHVFEYAVLCVLAYRFFSVLFQREPRRRIIWISAAFALAYGATDELHQFFIPNRGAHLVDVAIDAIGVALASAVMLVASSRRRFARSASRK